MGMPLREYYSVVRAAELLGCKVEDLLHWASIGAIKLYVSFEEGRGYVRFIGDGVEKEERNLDRSQRNNLNLLNISEMNFLKKNTPAINFP